METYSNYNLFVILFSAFGSLFTGYGLAVIGNTLGQPTFYTTMHVPAVPTDPAYSHTRTLIGAANGIFFGAGFVNCLIAAWTVDALGRRSTFRLAAAIGIVGGTLQCAAVNQAMYLVARAFTAIPVGITIVAMPIYYSEVAPPHSRGLMAGAHGCCINLGYFLAAWIGFACYYAADSTFGWRFPNAVVVLWAVLLLVGTLFVPESPRWLVQRQRNAEALKILCRLHHDPSDPEDTFAHRELNLIVKQLEQDRGAITGGGRWQLFTEKTYRKRLLLALMIAIGGQNAGILVINNYNVLLYESLGLTGSMPLLIAAVWNTIGFIANVVRAATSDRTGRRTALVYGYAFTMGSFVIATGLIGKYAETPTRGWAAAATVFLFIYVVGYGTCIDPNQFTVVSEIFPSHLRGQAVGISLCGLFLADTLWLELQPTAEGAIGWKYYLVFACLGMVHTIFLYLILFSP
ncbi:general substrate transporter [Exophiala viscosa]|uniref:general substrate transporter n=1 Tax=Exophiala viscosa TaxID=2486360 RepID=UPI00219389E0|nr:general substrate transporter [Exophiala viscosa]